MKGMLVVSIVSAALSLSAADSAVRLTAKTAEIVIDAKAPKTVRFAADELKDLLSKVLGGGIPVVTAPTAGMTPIVLGSNDWSVAAGIDTVKLARDAFVTKVADGRVYIAGRDDPHADLARAIRDGYDNPARTTEHATLNGVYAFLEDHAGCRFYFPGEIGTVTPRATAVTVPVGRTVTAPDSLVRDPYYYAGAASPFETAEMDRVTVRKTRVRYAAVDWLRKRNQTERIPCCHGQNGFAYTERFRQSHPEYLRMKQDGTRATELEQDGSTHHWSIRDLCHTSKVWDEIYADVKSYLTGEDASVRGIPSQWYKGKFGWNGNCVGRKYVDIMPQDGFQRCYCETCKKAYTDEPSYASDLIWGNTVRLAKRLSAEGVSGYVTQMVYSPYRRMPTFDIPSNVLVMVAQTGPWKVRHPAAMAEDLEAYRAWSEKCGHKVWAWTYPHKYGPTAIPDIPCMAPRAWGDYFQAAAPYILGSFAEAETENAIFNYLNFYVFSRVCWDAKTDVAAVLADHHAKMFGAGAAEMATFYAVLEDAWLEVAGNIVDTPLGPQAVVPSEYEQATRVYAPQKLSAWSGLIDAAAKKAAADPEATRRIAFMRRHLLEPLARRMADLADSISVEKELARRAAHPAKDILDHTRWGRYPHEGAPPFVDPTVKGPTGANAFHIRALKDRLYLTNVLDKPPHALKPNTTYRFSCFLKAKDVKPQNKNGGIYLELNNGAKNWAESNKTRITGTTEWLHHAMTFTTSDTLVPRPLAIVRIISATGDAWLDGLQLEEILPETR